MNNKQKRILLSAIFITTIGLFTAQFMWVSRVRLNVKQELGATMTEILNIVVDEVWKEETIIHVLDQLPSEVKDSSKITRYEMKDQKVISSSDNLSEMIRKRNNPSVSQQQQSNSKIVKRYLLEQIVERMIMLDIPIEQRVTLTQLDSLLLREMKKRHLDLEYRIAVTTEKGEIEMSSDYFNPTEKTMIYEKQLFPNDPANYVNKYYLKVYLPKEGSYVFKKLIPVSSASFVIIFLVLAIFVYTLLVIFRQKKISQIKNDFIGNITHELKTPIATISLAAQMLEETGMNSPEKLPRLSKMIRSQSTQLTFLVEQVLQASFAEKEATNQNYTIISVHRLLTEAANGLSLLFQEHNADVRLSFSASEDEIWGDPVHLKNSFANLLDNALKYSNGKLILNVTTHNKDKDIIVVIKDNGVGIEKAYLSKVFDRFFRVPSGNIHNVKGFGLGLSYVKQTVVSVGGRITCDSDLGKGTTFTLYLPLIKS